MIVGEITPVEVIWSRKTYEVPISQERELLRVHYRVTNKLADPVWFDDTILMRDMTNEKLWAPEQTHIRLPAFDSATEIPIMGIIDPSEIKGVYIVFESDLIGSNSDTVILKINMKVNTDGVIETTTLTTKTFIQDVDALAYRVEPFGGTSDETVPIDASLSFETNKAIPKSTLVVLWDRG